MNRDSLFPEDVGRLLLANFPDSRFTDDDGDRLFDEHVPLFEFAVPERSLEADLSHARCGADELLLRDFLWVGIARLSDLLSSSGVAVSSIGDPSRSLPSAGAVLQEEG